MHQFPPLRRVWKIAASIMALCLIGGAGRTAALFGRIAYLHDGAICITNPAVGGIQKVPLSSGALQLRLSADGDTVVFIAPRQTKSAEDAGSAAPYQVFYSRLPFRTATSLPLFLSKDEDASLTWTADGKADIAIGDLKTSRLDPQTGKIRVWNEDSSRPKGKAGRRGSVAAGPVAYTDGDGRVIVETPWTGKEQVLFSPKAPDALLAAARRAHAPGKLKDLIGEIDPQLWKDPTQWSVGAAALAPDRKSVFFAANLGTGMGAQGNTGFCFFAADIRTGKLEVLSKAGSFFGRVPIDCEVSPDGLRLFFATSAHSSAADNPYSAYVVDLLTQETRELLHADPSHKDDSNLMDGWCWSPDGKNLAISVLYYNVARLNPDSDPDIDKSTLYLFDAATGHAVRQIPNARAPQWTAR